MGANSAGEAFSDPSCFIRIALDRARSYQPTRGPRPTGAQAPPV